MLPKRRDDRRDVAACQEGKYGRIQGSGAGLSPGACHGHITVKRGAKGASHETQPASGRIIASPLPPAPTGHLRLVRARGIRHGHHTDRTWTALPLHLRLDRSPGSRDCRSELPFLMRVHHPSAPSPKTPLAERPHSFEKSSVPTTLFTLHGDRAMVGRPCPRPRDPMIFAARRPLGGAGSPSRVEFQTVLEVGRRDPFILGVVNRDGKPVKSLAFLRQTFHQ